MNGPAPIVFALAALVGPLGSGCESESKAPSHEARGTDDVVELASAGVAPQPSRPPREPAADCEELAERGTADLLDAALVVRLCPDRPPTRRELRAALLWVDHPDGVADLLPRLSDAAELDGIARLIRRAPVKHDVLPAPHADPRTAIVSPASEDVLGQVDAAIANATRARVGPGDRIRGRAYLAKTYGAAFDALGLAPQTPLPPFARRLAGTVLHWGLGFCVSYGIRPQRGYQGLRNETEVRILRTVLALQRGSWHGDDARTALAWHDARAYLRRADVAQRLAREVERLGRSHGEFGLAGAPPAGVETLYDDGVEFDRLIDLGLTDLAIERGLALGRRVRPPGYGLAPVEAHLIARLESSPEDRDAVLAAFAAARKSRPTPPELGGTPWETVSRNPDTKSVSDEVAQWIASAPAQGFGRRHAIARAFETARTRPDVLRHLLERDELPSWALHWALSLLETRVDRSTAVRRAITKRARQNAEQFRADPRQADEALRREAAELRGAP